MLEEAYSASLLASPAVLPSTGLSMLYPMTRNDHQGSRSADYQQLNEFALGDKD